MPRRNAFTLTEILIVIGIIVLLIAMAVPALNFIRGGKSIEAAENQVSALLGRARNEALGLQETVGVAVFIRAADQRATLAFVRPVTFSPYLTTATYEVGDYVSDNTDGDPEPEYFVCIQDSAGGNDPPNASYWHQTDRYAIEAIEERDFFALPPGVGAQVLDNSEINDNGTPANLADDFREDDGYYSVGAILFDGLGRLLRQPISFAARGRIGRLAYKASATVNIDGEDVNDNLALDSGEDIDGDGALDLMYSSLGIVLYDRESFENLGYDYDDVDLIGPVNGYAANELAEENWLDRNAMPLLINRFNGTLTRGQ